MTEPDRDAFDEFIGWALRQQEASVDVDLPTDECPVAALIAGGRLTTEQEEHVDGCPFCARLVAAGADPRRDSGEVVRQLHRDRAAAALPAADLRTGDIALPLVASPAIGGSAFEERFTSVDGSVTCTVTVETGALVAVVDAAGDDLSRHVVRVTWRIDERVARPESPTEGLQVCLIPLRRKAGAVWTGWVTLPTTAWREGDRIALEVSEPLPLGVLDEERSALAMSIGQAGGSTVDTWRDIAAGLPAAIREEIEPWLR